MRPESVANPASFGDRGERGATDDLRRIGKYLVIERLDAGGQAQVYRVMHPELARELVLKLGRRPIGAHRPAGPEGEGEPSPSPRPALLHEAGCWPAAIIPTWSGSSTWTSTKAGRSWSWNTCRE